MIGTFRLGDIRRGGLLALAAATLFGLSTPAAKAIVGNVQPLLLAGLLYLGSGLGLTAFILLGHRQGATSNEGRFRGSWALLFLGERWARRC